MLTAYTYGDSTRPPVMLKTSEADLETVLTVQLTVGSDLEPAWTLVSDRAAAQDQTRNLSWSDRVRIAPTRIGAMADYNLSWRQGSVLNRVSEERADASAALARSPAMPEPLSAMRRGAACRNAKYCRDGSQRAWHSGR